MNVWGYASEEKIPFAEASDCKKNPKTRAYIRIFLLTEQIDEDD
jgi:hypothetical protein